MEFEWDAGKAAENERKHDVSFMEAASSFWDPLPRWRSTIQITATTRTVRS